MTSGSAERTALEELLGGRRGLLDTAVPPVVFVSVNTAVGFRPALLAALGAGAALLLVRLVRRERLRNALGGFFLVAIAVGFAAYTGEARDYFLPGILMNIGWLVLCVVSVAVGRPILGVVLARLEGHGADWHQDERVRRLFALATLIWAGAFATRILVQGSLYLADRPGWLAVARLVTGWPLFLATLPPTIALIRRARAVPATQG